MAFLDILNQKQGKTATSFTDQAQAMKQALSGQEQAPVAGTQKTSVQEKVAEAEEAQKVQGVAEQAQQVEQAFSFESDKIAAMNKIHSDSLLQKKSDAIAATQRAINDVYDRLGKQRAQLSSQQYQAGLAQLEFLTNLNDKKFADQVVAEGDKRRLDNEIQMKTAIMYATFNDSIDKLNTDLSFQRALKSDQREWDRYLATISPEAAINNAIYSMRAEAKIAATTGMAREVGGDIKEITKGYFQSKANEPKPAAATPAASPAAPATTPAQPTQTNIMTTSPYSTTA